MKKLIFMVTVLIVFIASQIYIDIYRDKQQIIYVNNNLGELQYHIKPYEKNLIYSQYLKLAAMQFDREQTQKAEPSSEEQRLRKNFNATMNRLTYKYIYDPVESSDEQANIESPVDPQRYPIELISKLNGIVTEQELKSIEKNYQEYLKEYEWKFIEEIRNILLKYPQLKADIIVEQLQNPVDIKAYFDLDENKELVYADLIPIIDQKPTPEELEQYQVLWHDIKKALSNDMLKTIKTFIVYTDGRDETFAFVNYFGNQGENWYLAADVVDSYDQNGVSKDFYLTVVHEYGHILTLSTDQVNYGGEPSYGTYFENEITAKETSYLNQFYKRFWVDIYEDGTVANNLEDENDRACFYFRHENEFPTEYGSSILSEDICEAFAYFVMEDKPYGNTIKEQKIRFFYEFPELVKIRNEIRQNLEL